ncbi:hypothetical protein G5B30_08960 [Sphingobacterium sp. SGG-5]|uniref:M60 family metallopeptidase n=1 Tax=Sphingobacterium sp. SGG-5 TaxID=2710881 RepID=UPI0013EAD93F|nr:M60 family metallopeptidase [Sphingobacterium sp. SGG-5]NGM62042.1 hypothetical protein [Sphingobacterium sp. SGG-5]
MLRKISFFFIIGFLTLQLNGRERSPLINHIQHDLQYFDNGLASHLNKKFKKSDLSKFKNEDMRTVAEGLLNDTYNTQYRLASYQAKLSPNTLGQKLSIGNGYSRYENVTGIYLPKGKHIVLVDGIQEDKEVSLWVPNWNRRAPEGISPTKDPNGWGIKKEIFRLKNGINIVELNNFDGLAYIHFYSETPDKAHDVQVHFVNAAVNGYFDSSIHSDQDWNSLLDNAVYPIIDAFGKHIQIVYPVEDCKKYAYGRGVELLNNYDTLVALQFRIIGLEKYNRIPDNKILSRVNYNYYMFRDGDGVAYMGTKPGYALNRLIDPHLLMTSGACWGFSHEIGHVHQLRNYFNWAGMGEVSNNVMTMYVTTSVGQKSNLGNRNHYEKARDSIIHKGISYLEDADVMNRLVPLWQLQIYFTTVGNNPNFYPDLFETFRQQSAEHAIQNPDRNPAIYQLNFVRKACEVSKVDLTEFFDKYGFFKVGTFHVKDYRSAQYTMTKEMVDECKEAILAMQLPKPSVDITMLTD